MLSQSTKSVIHKDIHGLMFESREHRPLLAGESIAQTISFLSIQFIIVGHHETVYSFSGTLLQLIAKIAEILVAGHQHHL